MENSMNITLTEREFPSLADIKYPLIEYNFSWDDTGMKLSDLWTIFEIAFCEKKAADCQDELYAFVDMFIDIYKEWKPKEAAESSYYNVERKNVTGDFKHCIATQASLSLGHPFRFIRGLISWINSLGNINQARDFHKIETLIEILTRSPHNRVLLRYNKFDTIILNLLVDSVNSLSMNTDSTSNNEELYLTLKNVLSILYNFLPTHDDCDWLTLESAFETGSTNVHNILNTVFVTISCYSLPGRAECVIDCSWELTVLMRKLFELIHTRELDRSWVILLHKLILITAGNVKVSTEAARTSKVLNLVNQMCKNMGSQEYRDMFATVLKDTEISSLNVDMIILLQNVCSVSDASRQEAASLGCYELINIISC